MAERDPNHSRIERSDFSREDPHLTVRGRGRWVLPLILLVALPAAGIFALYESGRMNEPAAGASMAGRSPVDDNASGTSADDGLIGTSGSRAPTVPGPDEPDAAAIREVETITGVNDGHPLIGRKVDLHVPVAETANDYAFWIGSKDNRVLVVPRRDHRDSAQRQQGKVADHGIAPVEAGKVVAITGSIQKLPKPEERHNWNLSDKDHAEVAAMGVYVRADTVTAQ